MDWKRVIPAAGEEAVDLDEAREIRLRPGQPLQAVFPWGLWQGKRPLDPAQISLAAQALSGHALAARSGELARGFLPLPGGHRLGVAGIMGENGLREITSLCLRIAHEAPGCGEEIFPRIRGFHSLLIGPPGSGKTTLLRDLIRLYALSGFQVGVADERGEIAACQGGVPGLDVGPMTDVITGMEKEKAVPLLIRTLSPQVIAVDELGDPRDAGAILEAIRCGALVLATVHGTSKNSVSRRPGMEALFRGAFEKTVLLTGVGQPLSIGEEDAWDG